MTTIHALAFTIGTGQYAWPVCGSASTRGGPWHVESGRFGTPVTCRRCIKQQQQTFSEKVRKVDRP